MPLYLCIVPFKKKMLSSIMHIPWVINYSLKNYNKQYGLNICLLYSYAHREPFPPPRFFYSRFVLTGCLSIHIPYYSCCIIKRFKIVSSPSSAFDYFHILLHIKALEQPTDNPGGVSPGQEAFGSIGFSDT